MPTKSTTNNQTLEQQLFKMADTLRGAVAPSDYKHVVLGLIFLKYISDGFESLYQTIVDRNDFSDPEDKDEYTAENCFWVPAEARWSYLHGRSKLPSIGEDIDKAMLDIEAENPNLKGVLPKVYNKESLDTASLGKLLDTITDIDLGKTAQESKDLLGRVYEYFMGQFADKEGSKGGEFFTPRSIVGLMVEMLEPYQGRVYDPCCGSGGMFVMSEKFILEHQGKIDNISVYGQELNQATYRLCKMNLAIHNLNSDNIRWNNQGTLLSDALPDKKFDFVLANPPFNISDWSGELLKGDGRWKYGVPPAGNANFAWIQHISYHLSTTGQAGVVLANGSLSSQTSGEGDIRQKLVESGLVECIVALPKQLFFNTGIPACIWFLSKNKEVKKNQNVLFIDATEVGYMQDRVHRAFSKSDLSYITDTYHSWKKSQDLQILNPLTNKELSQYQDMAGFCKSANIEEITKHNFVLTPGRYVGLKTVEDDGIPLADKINALTKTLGEQMTKEKELDDEIRKQLAIIGFEF
jgi:type I restriction enzyme M protein